MGVAASWCLGGGSSIPAHTRTGLIHLLPAQYGPENQSSYPPFNSSLLTPVDVSAFLDFTRVVLLWHRFIFFLLFFFKGKETDNKIKLLRKKKERKNSRTSLFPK